MRDSPPGETLAQRVRRLRKRLGMSQDEFSKAVDVSTNQVTSVENGTTRNLRSDTLTRYARVLGESPEYIVTGVRSSSDDALPGELMSLYRQLAPQDQYAFLHIGRALKESRTVFGRQEEEDEDGLDTSRMAAYPHDELEDHVRRENEDEPA